MIELRKRFKRKGVEFTQLYKDENIVIYMTDINSLEIFRYRIAKPDITCDEEHEHYPSDSHFGSWAWCATSLSSFRRILEKHFAHNCDIDKIYVYICAIINTYLPK